MNFHFDECCNRYPKFSKLVKVNSFPHNFYFTSNLCTFPGVWKAAKMPKPEVETFHAETCSAVTPISSLAWRLPQASGYRQCRLWRYHFSSKDCEWCSRTCEWHCQTRGELTSDWLSQSHLFYLFQDKFQTMLKLQSRLGDWEFIRPGRELLKEGELQKISRKGVGPRYFILLSDCLLYTSYHGSWAGDSTSLKVSYTIPLNQLHVHVPTAEDFQNEFSITSNVRSCTLKARYTSI